MNKKIALIVTSVVIAASLAIGGTLAFFTDKGNVSNVITMGDVRITLTEPGFSDKTGNTLKLKNVMPNQEISKDPTITNIGGHDAYIRCKAAVEGLPEENKALESFPVKELLSGLNIDGGKWVLNANDGYYYYQSILPKRPDTGTSSVQFFTKLTIPEKWDNAFAAKEFSVKITAEAIQADNFTPHKTGDVIDGWKYSDSTDVTAQSAPPTT